MRVGNGAYDQLQLDVFGEIADVLFQAFKAGMQPSERGRALQPLVMEYLATAWRQPDEGIWETRGGRQHFVHSKVMAWVAFDRAAKGLEAQGFDESVRHWRAIADEIHAEVCGQGFDRDLNSFVQAYGSKRLDASLLLIPLVGFLPATDPRIQGTLRAVIVNKPKAASQKSSLTCRQPIARIFSFVPQNEFAVDQQSVLDRSGCRW